MAENSTTQSCDGRHRAPLYGGDCRVKEKRKQREGLAKDRILKRDSLDERPHLGRRAAPGHCA
jgi:hypothetical protein